MMKPVVCAFAVASLALMGCGSSICEDFKDASEDLEEKAAPCDDSTGEPEEEFNVQQCESDIEKCTDDDKAALEEYIRCMGEVDTCEKGKEDAFGSAVLTCAFSAVGKLSDACTSTISQEIRRTVAGYSVAR